MGCKAAGPVCKSLRARLRALPDRAQPARACWLFVLLLPLNWPNELLLPFPDPEAPGTCARRQQGEATGLALRWEHAGARRGAGGERTATEAFPHLVACHGVVRPSHALRRHQGVRQVPERSAGRRPSGSQQQPALAPHLDVVTIQVAVGGGVCVEVAVAVADVVGGDHSVARGVCERGPAHQALALRAVRVRRCLCV